MEVEHNALKWLMDQWTGKLVQILESMTDQRPSIVWDESGLGEANAQIPENSLIWEQALSLWPEPVIWIVAPEPAWHDLGSRTLRAAGIEDVEPADARNTWLEVLNQSLSGLVKELGRRLQREVASGRGEEASSVSPDLQFASVAVDYGDGALPPLFVAFSPLLLAELDAVSGEQQDAAGGADGASDILTARPGPEAAGISRTFDLLLDVGLPVSISFGRTQMQIRDVLKLTTGSIVELNRTVSEPVEVIVNGCVIARGDVVVVEGNYGVRIRQIISRQDRLRTGTGPAQRVQKGVDEMPAPEGVPNT